MFGVNQSLQRCIQSAGQTARQALKVSFTPCSLGFGHVTGQRIIDQHTTSMSQQLMCDGGKDTAILIVDGAYIYIQSPQETISAQTNDDRLYNWLHRGLHLSFSF